MEDEIWKDKVNNIIPFIYREMESDQENESENLLDYYVRCNTVERAAINNTLIYLCGWSFETILEKCCITTDEFGEPQIEDSEGGENI